MLEVLSVTGPIYLVILTGFLTTRAGWFTQVEMRVFGKFVIKLALPALVFSAVAQRQILEILDVDVETASYFAKLFTQSPALLLKAIDLCFLFWGES